MTYREQMSTGFVPVLTSQAGSCLIFANWEETGVQVLSLHLADLLMKPGLSLLKEIETIRNYVNWTGEIVLNAMLPPPNREDIYSIRSVFDGSIIKIDITTLFALINNLKADKVILPRGSIHYFNQFWSRLALTQPYFHVSEQVPDGYDNFGQYSTCEPEKPFSVVLTEVSSSDKPFYFIGEFDFIQCNQLTQYKNCHFESDKPARDGMMGMVYRDNGIDNILDEKMRNDHRRLVENCLCQTCSQKLTRAYCHHLFQHTPLLAQRFLIQHNVYYALANLSLCSS